MDFLQTASVLIPTLTGLALTIYNGEAEVLEKFERQYCFSTELQSAFTASSLSTFFKVREEKFIYEIVDPMETHLLVFRAGESYVLLGPFVESKWNEARAKQLLAKHGASAGTLFSYKMYYCQLPVFEQNYVTKVALLIAEWADEVREIWEVRTVYTHEKQGSPRLMLQEAYEETAIVNRRYYIEGQFIEAISCGKTKEALQLLKEMERLSVGLRFVSDSMKDQIAGAGIMRTLIRMGAERGGLAPIVIDSISQEYAQQMQHTVSGEKLERLMGQLVVHFCRIIKDEKKNNYSVYTKRAIDYMSINLSKAITVAELAEISGLAKSYFVQLFGKETGMTVKQYLAQKRCEAASELLLDSRLSIQQIAAYVGYADNNYFSKVFKACVGVSPADYRKNQGISR